MHSLLAQALSLLVVPVMLVLVAGLFTTMQIFIQLGRETARDQAIADQTAEFQKFLEEFRAQEASLQDYRDVMVT
jgi:competence protein ComGF